MCGVVDGVSRIACALDVRLERAKVDGGFSTLAGRTITPV